MEKLHTHYDNLKVMRTAPASVIRAAYKTLSQQYHPDRNPGNLNAERIMKILNASYAVLSDEQRRQEYDEFLAKAEQATHTHTHTQPKAEQPKTASQKASETVPPRARPSTTSKAAASSQPTGESQGRFKVAFYLWRYGYLILLGGGVAVAVISNWFDNAQKERAARDAARYQYKPPTEITTRPKIVEPAYQRPLTSPTGAPWPRTASYIEGFPQRHDNGLSRLTVDNSRNTSDVFVKVIPFGSSPKLAARVFFIPAKASFTAEKMSPGRYDVRYQDLSTGGLAKSDTFEISETATYDGVRYSDMTMTLYKVANGNMKTSVISENEF